MVGIDLTGKIQVLQMLKEILETLDTQETLTLKDFMWEVEVYEHHLQTLQEVDED